MHALKHTHEKKIISILIFVWIERCCIPQSSLHSLNLYRPLGSNRSCSCSYLNKNCLSGWHGRVLEKINGRKLDKKVYPLEQLQEYLINRSIDKFEWHKFYDSRVSKTKKIM